MCDFFMMGILFVFEIFVLDVLIFVEYFFIWIKEIVFLYEIQVIEDDEWDVKKGEIEKWWRKEWDVINLFKEKKKFVVKGKVKKVKKVEDDGCFYDEDQSWGQNFSWRGQICLWLYVFIIVYLGFKYDSYYLCFFVWSYQDFLLV